MHISDEYARAVANFIGNYMRPGMGSETGNYTISATEPGGNGLEIYVQGNIDPHRPSDDMDEALVVKPKARRWIVPTRHNTPFVTTTSAFEAYYQVLVKAGATIGIDNLGRSYWRRDSVDERIFIDVANGTGNYIDAPSEVGGWPDLVAGTVPTDTDHDGMPDDWEKLHDFDPNDPSDGPLDADGDGYTNIEEYLNQTDPSKAGGNQVDVASMILSLKSLQFLLSFFW